MSIQMTCDAIDPERPGILNEDGTELLVDPVYCSGRPQWVDGKPVPHKGKHRVRLLAGILHRWGAK